MDITLNSKGYSISVSTIGAELKSFKMPADNGTLETLWNADAAFWGRSSPVLFPNIGNLRNNTYTVDGKEYTLEKHGFARNMNFKVSDKTDTHARFTIESTPETLQQYPYEFQLDIEYDLCGPLLNITYTVTNRQSQGDMFYHIGGHPGFLCPFHYRISDSDSIDASAGDGGSSLDDYILEFDTPVRLEATVYDLQEKQFSASHKKLFAENSATLQLKEGIFRDDALFFRNIPSKSVTLRDTVSGKAIKFGYPDFCSVAFWKPDTEDAHFICFEPWNGGAIAQGESSELSQRYDIRQLTAGSSKKYRLSVELLG